MKTGNNHLLHFRFLAVIIAATFFFASCSDDDSDRSSSALPLELRAEDFGEDVLITTTKEALTTRSSLTSKGEDAVASVWADADSIRLFVDDRAYTYKAKLMADSSTVVFVTADTAKVKNAEGKKVYAVFCDNIRSFSMKDGIVSSSASLGYLRDVNPHDSKWGYMYAIGTIADGRLALDFKQMFAYVKITVPESSVRDFTHIILYSQNCYIIPQNLEYDLDSGAFTDGCINSGMRYAYATIDSAATSKDGLKEFYMPVFPTDGTNAFKVSGYKESSNRWGFGGMSARTQDLYYCDEPEEGIGAGELFCIDTRNSYATSSDYSKDGKVEVLEKASKGAGISLVFMGEGFADTDIASGKYERVMRREMERFFSVEPFKSYRDRFNSYMVYRVAKTNDVTKFSDIDEETAWEDAMKYTEKAVTFQGADTVARAIVVYNGNYVGRSATMFTVYGHFASLVLNNYPTVVCHEAGGHGFALLGDEYVEQGYEMRRLPEYEKQTILNYQKFYDAFANISVDAENPVWAKFLNDSRYTSEKLSCYEGAYTYGRKVYRPNENSVMRDHTESSAFNAPSREAIFKRILQYSEAGYTYSDADFYTYDAINYATPSEAKARKARSTGCALTNSACHITPLGKAPVMKEHYSFRKN